MKWLQNAYTRRFNVRHGLWGRLFGDRYKSVLVEGAGYYYETLLDYIHLNPARARLIDLQKEQSLLDYPWSSVAGGYALPPSRRAPWLAANAGLAAFGLADTTAGRRKFVERLDRRMVAEGMEHAGIPPLDPEVDARCSHLRRGWFWGSQEFGQRALKLGRNLLGRKRSRNYGASLERRAHGEQEAFGLLEAGLAAAGLKQEELKALPGSDDRKAELGVRLQKACRLTICFPQNTGTAHGAEHTD